MGSSKNLFTLKNKLQAYTKLSTLKKNWDHQQNNLHWKILGSSTKKSVLEKNCEHQQNYLLWKNIGITLKNINLKKNWDCPQKYLFYWWKGLKVVYCQVFEGSPMDISLIALGLGVDQGGNRIQTGGDFKLRIIIISLNMPNKDRQPNMEIIDLSPKCESSSDNDSSVYIKKAPLKKNCQCKYDKRRSMRKKQLLKETKYFRQHDKIVNSHISCGFKANISPHIILKQWFHRIRKNA